MGTFYLSTFQSPLYFYLSKEVYQSIFKHEYLHFYLSKGCVYFCHLCRHRVELEVKRSSHNTPCSHRTHQHWPRQPRRTDVSMQSRSFCAVCVVVVAQQGNENIHNPHIVGPPVITHNNGLLTPAEPQNDHSRIKLANGFVCPYKFSGAAMKAAAHIQRRGQKTAFPTFLLRQPPEPLTDGFTEAVITANAHSWEILSSSVCVWLISQSIYECVLGYMICVTFPCSLLTCS